MKYVLLAVFLVMTPGAAPAADASFRYFYEDVFEPFFRLDPSAGLYHAARPGATASSFSAAKAPGVFRVFIIGGSIAQNFQGPGALDGVLTAAGRGRRIEAINCGMGGYDSPREELVLREILDYSPDAVLLMSGHNEFLSLPWLPRWRVRILGLLRMGGGPRGASPAPSEEELSRREASRLREFEETVARMAAAARARGVAFVALLPPLNVADAPPIRALPRVPAFRRGWSRALAGDCPGASREWARSEGERGDRALAEFFRARCLEKMRRVIDADAAYEAALKADAPLTGRCGPACRDALRRGVERGGGWVADADAAFRALAAPRLPGLDYFSDRVHWRRVMHPVVAGVALDALRRALPDSGWRASPRAGRPGPRGEEERIEASRYAFAAMVATGERELIAPAFAALERLLKERPGAFEDLDETLRVLETGSASRGAAWGMPALSVPREVARWHMGAIALWSGRIAAAEAEFHRAERDGLDEVSFLLDSAVLRRRSGDAAGAEAVLVRVAARDASTRTAALIAATRAASVP